MKRDFILFLICFLACHCMYGQIIVKPGAHYHASTGVSNDGIVCGYSEWRAPYELWNTVTGEIAEIGGTAPGEGIGGRGMFSSDGKFLSGTLETTVAISQEWQRKVFHEAYALKKVLAGPLKGHIVGKASAGDKGIYLSSADRNRIWIERFATPAGGINSISATARSLFITGESCLAKSINGGTSWTDMTPVAEDVSSYLNIDFSDDSKGVAGALLEGDEYAVYATQDAGASWIKATGLSGTIVDISHIGSTYYLVTKEGKVWQSDNNGEAWTEMAAVSNEPRRIKFYDENTGVITAVGAVYFTEDKGANWKSVEVAANRTGQITWNDVVWMSKEKMLLVGTKDVIYLSQDGGKNWTWDNEQESDGKTELFSADADANYILVSGDNSTLYRKERAGSLKLHQCSRYDVEKNEWKELGFLGGTAEDTSGSGYSISGDGKTVVGFSYKMPDEYKIYRKSDNYKGSGHGVAWSEEEGFMDMGSLFDNLIKSTRCDAVSEDGSVVVGYQETKYGDWAAAVWRKNPEGGYTPNDFILIDPEKGADDLTNLRGSCDIVSANGQWIGGQSYQNLWLWSSETGSFDLDMSGKLLYVDNEGTIAIGSKAVWTKEAEVMPIADYLASIDINLEDAGFGPFYPDAVSRNGRYIAGRTSLGQVAVTICIDLQYMGTGIQDNTASSGRIAVSQSPVADWLTVQLPAGEAQLYLSDMQGRQIKARSCTTDQAVIQVSDVPEGLYILNVATGKARETFKIQIRR